MNKEFFILAILIITLLLFLGGVLDFDLPKIQPKPLNLQEIPISAGVVPSDLIANAIITKFFQKLSNYSSIPTVVLLSPDHSNQTTLANNHFITISPQTKEKREKNDSLSLIINTLTQNYLVKIDDSAIKHNQGITNLMPFFREYLPGTKVIPILISPRATEDETRELVNQLNTVVPRNSIFVAETNFANSLPRPLLLLHDTKSIRVLTNFEENELQNLDVDSWQALYAARYFARLRNMEKPDMIAHKTSFDFIQSLPSNSILAREGGTSYYSVIFGKGTKESISAQSILMIGDIMMARGVALLTDKYGLEYPYKNIKKMFKGVDIMYGNLEGPVVANAPRVSMHSVNFGFPPKIVKLLRNLGFNLLNIANNHMKDRGAAGIESTRKYLKENNIVPLGDYQSGAAKYYYKKGNLLFIGMHLVYGNQACVNEVLKNVREIKKDNPNTYIIITPHWGTEYTALPNQFQKDTAHALIDAGADAIIGHHPHVVQAIEEYKGKPIFYSLGNFVFDMYFSKAVQQELSVGIDYRPSKVIFYLIPMQSHKSQLAFMRGKEKDDFLHWLSSISSPSWDDSIQKGIIKISSNSPLTIHQSNNNSFSSSTLLSHNYCVAGTEFSTEKDKKFCYQDPYLIKERGVEINLTDKKVTLYNKRHLMAVLPLRYQSPGNVWFESPTGLYKIGTREKLHWSTIGRVWMPYSMQYYEDFFLHGIPYYPNGRKLTSTVSGGCLRFADNVAKKLYEFVKIGDPVFVYATLDKLTLKKDMVFPLDLDNSYIYQRFYNPWRRYRRFGGDRVHLNLDYYNHTGVDFKLKPGAIDKHVYAVQDGRVERIISTSKDDHGMGNTIILSHQLRNKKIYSLYAHLSSIKIGLREGDSVQRGDVLGTIGNSGLGCLNYWRLGENSCNSNDPPNEFLHFEIKTAPVLDNPRGGKVCRNKYNKSDFCYGYAPHPLSKLGYINPISFLFEFQGH